MAIVRLGVVGKGELLDEFAVAAARAGFSIVRIDLDSTPEAVRARLLSQTGSLKEAIDIEATDVLMEIGDCDFVVEHEHASSGINRLHEIESHMSGGAVLASLLNGTGAETLSGFLSRPTQFLGLRVGDDLTRLAVEATERTAPGVVETARWLLRSLGVRLSMTA